MGASLGNYVDGDNLDAYTATSIDESHEIMMVTVSPSSEGMSEDEKQELANELLRAQASRARVQAQLDEKEVQFKLRMADAVIAVLDYWWIFGAAFLCFIGFIFWLGLNTGRSV